MFNLFGKKNTKPKTALDAVIIAVYGDPPPPKTAKVGEAIHIAHEMLLMELISKDEVTKVANELNSGPMPYSTHDLALSVALNFFKQPKRISELADAQMLARLQAVEWLKDKKAVPALVKSFEDTLYKLYKP